jgi:8-oxo-dGTP diphosphatase
MRDVVCRLIYDLVPLDDLEREHIDFALDWIASGAEICRTAKPAVPNPHLVTYFMITSPDRERVLLADHKKAGLWLPPGGHVEPEEHPKGTVKREALEELGFNAEFIFEEPLFLTVKETAGPVDRHTDISLWYLLQGDPCREWTFDPQEFHQIRWFSLEEIPFSSAEPYLNRFLQKMNYAISL